MQQSKIQEIKSKIDLKSYIENNTGLTFDKSNRTKQCPICGHNSKTNTCFAINPNDLSRFKCFGTCGKEGDIINFVQYTQNINIEKAINLLYEDKKLIYSSPQPKQPARQKEDRQKTVDTIINSLRAFFFAL